MNFKETMAELKKQGTEQNRKVYARYGVSQKMYGVSVAALTAMKKKIKQDHDLAVKLWNTGNHDARVLAGMVVDPEQMSAVELEEWLKACDNYVTTGTLSGIAAKTKFARKKADKWAKSTREWTSTAGYNVLTSLAMRDGALPDTYFAEHLQTIEKNIHSSLNRTRYSMNNALIAIAARSASLEKSAVAAAKRIGRVVVDHGETGCKTPDAIPYIAKMKAHKKKRA